MYDTINFKKLVAVLNEIEEKSISLEIPITTIDKINDVFLDITFDDKATSRKMLDACLGSDMNVDRDESRNSLLVRFTYDTERK